MSVGEYCNRQVIVTEKAATITEVAVLMRNHHVGSIIVVDRDTDLNTPLGIVTDRDIVIELLAAGAPTEKVTAGDLMSTQLYTAREVDGMWETLQRMRQHGVRRMPVVNDEGVLVGILSIDDVLEMIHEQLGSLVKLISNEQQIEHKARRTP
jgi:CBS domain-containing protein